MDFSMIGELNRLRRIQPAWVQKFKSCKRKLASNHHSPLQLQHFHRRQLSQHLPAQLQAFQSRQPQHPRIQVCQVLQGMRRFQTFNEQIHGRAISLGASEAALR